ncbi:oogenesis-related isoform X2 [Rhincodon typus]|uniref:oogenesis-related isoform X2 n=1 Tax=Rhincodon typus TaxID=259920 RepID=UPI00202E5887|nr:oogenesis-related isoform X2 [Rhincodon typus]
MALPEDVVSGSEEHKDVQEICSATTEAPLFAFFSRMSRLGPLKYLFSVIWRLTTWASSSVPVEEVKAADTNMLVGRRWVTGKKRLSRLARFVFSMTPYRLQQMLGFPVPSSLGQELRSSPNKPYGKGSKRKQDDLADEELCWVESLACDLPEDDDSVEDPTYEPSKYYTDSEEVSEEHRECNDTETDLEVEETGDPGLLRLKETPHHEQNENDVPCIDSNERINS